MDRLLQLLIRPPGEVYTLDHPHYVWGWVSIFFLFIAFIGYQISPYLVTEYKNLTTFEYNYKIAPQQWHTFYEESKEPCTEVIASNSKCLANPLNQTLWTATSNKSDPDHFSKAKLRKGKTFWLGLELNTDVINQLRQQHAFDFILGQINGGYRIWANGTLVSSGDGQRHELNHLSLGNILLTAPQLHLAVEINHNLNSSYPDSMNGIEGTGFAEANRARNYLRIQQFNTHTVYILLGSFYLLSSLLLFFFWWSARKKQEIFFTSLFCLSQFFFIIIYSDFISFKGDRAIWYSIHLIALFLTGATAFLAGGSFARVPRTLLINASIFLFPIPFFTILTASDSNRVFSSSTIIAQYIVPTLYYLGSALCLLQLLILIKKNNWTVILQHRGIRLLSYALTIAVLGSFYTYASRFTSSLGGYTFAHIFAQIFLIILLAYVVLYDYKEQEKRVQSFSWSEHFNRQTTPISGLFLRLDLMNSEKLPAATNDSSSYGVVLSRIRLRFIDKIKTHRGSIIFHEGDELMALFDPQRYPDLQTMIYECLVSLNAEAHSIQSDLNFEGVINPQIDIRFRASLVGGTIIPYFEKTLDGKMEPKWRDGDLTNGPLVKSKRIMDLHKQLNQISGNVFIFEQTIADVFSKNLRQIKWLYYDYEVSNKKNQNFRIAIIDSEALENRNIEEQVLVS